MPQYNATALDKILRMPWWLPLMAFAMTLLCRSVIAADAPPHPHWSFQPIQRPAIPTVTHASLVESPVDAFILEKLEASGLELAPEADKRTLIRRANYDLIGLPPSPQEVADFLADESPTAFATVIERLLASPHYGERWGRHWLDVARYANTYGDTGSSDPVSHFAFTYRDYVVRAFNNDLPYDQFLLEQIAADQLEHAEQSPTLAATGFVTVGRRFLSNVHDTIDDRIDVVTRGTMGLTVSCARCHDHKYDPIPTQDYYSLYGVFSSSDEPNPLPVIGTPDPVAVAEYQAQRAQAEARRTEFIRQQETQVVQNYRKLTAEFLLATRPPVDPAGDEAQDAAFPEAAVQRAGIRRWRKSFEKLNRETDPVFAPWFAFAAIPDAEFVERAKELATKVAANTLPHPVNPLVAQAFAGEPPESLIVVAKRYAQLMEEVSKPPQAPAANAPAPAADPARDALRIALIGDDAPGHLSENAIRKLFTPTVNGQLQEFANELNRVESEHAGAPIRAMGLVDRPQPQNARIFTRGNPNNPGAEVPRQFLEVLAGANRQPFTHGSGRLELARAIASRDNPLTARVLINRVWLHHFGEGLVATPDDFGLRSDPPTHPQLLDYLATRFMDDGWSIKKLHRLLMLSRTYRQSSDNGLRSATVDPENRLLSKMNRRRLDFESLRDTLLAVAGNLDHTVGGRAVELNPLQKVANGGAFIGNPSDNPPSTRRAIYGFIDRQNLPGLLRAFDFADPDTICGRRYVTTVPQQALFFFNNPFVMQQACNLAARSEIDQFDPPDNRIQNLYQQIFQRDPTAAEIDLANRFIAAEQSATTPPAVSPAETFERVFRPRRSRNRDRRNPLTPWDRLAHVLLMSDELMFID